MSLELPVRLSTIDEARFGFRTAIASQVPRGALSDLMNFCHSNSVVLLIARCLTTELQTVQTMERKGFLLMDTLVYYAQDLVKHPIPQDTAQVKVRSVQPGEEHAVKAVAAESFREYFGHYHADERLDRAKCDAIYPDWALRSCVSRDVADEVLVAELSGSVVGFATLRLNSAEEGEGVLFGIAPQAQRRGIYRSFMIQGMNWCLSKGARRMVVSTQITNVAVQKVWVRIGFEPSHAWYTLHKWFDDPGEANDDLDTF
jgi:GNAT superfamily N-acetyltransferase